MGTENLERKIFYGGPIVTINDRKPFVQAVGISGEKILSIGNLKQVKNAMGESYTLINLNGNTMLPGFIDSHLHPIIHSFFLLNPDLTTINSLDGLKKLFERICKTKKEDELIIGFNLKEENFDKPILPTKWDLDEICKDKPLFIMRYDGHIGIANSKALELAGISEDTISPEGGEIRKNEDGELTGIISEKALDLILSKISFPGPEEIKEAAKEAFKILAQKGITSLHGILSTDAKGEFGGAAAVEMPIYRSIQDIIPQNWYALINTDKPKKLVRLKKPPLDNGTEYSKFKLNCLKLYLDGTFGAKTACMYEPFTDAPGQCGFCVVDENEIYEKMKIAHRNGFQIGIHAIGDKGNRIVVDLYKKLLKEFPRENHRHRIEHASMLTPDVIRDMRDYGIIASCQPPFLNSEYHWLEKRLGKDRLKYTYPFKSIISAGVILASGSDCPIEDPSPILGLHALINRNGIVIEECISIEEALKTYTINAAYAAFEENVKGSIEEGKLADFVILDKNPLETEKDRIKDIKVVETIIRGKSVFRID
ncbi:MAG: amidohydrolase [Promethearchaeota archaeon]